MKGHITKHWALLSAAIFPLASIVPFLLLRGLFAKLFHLFIPLFMVAVRAYWSDRRKRKALKVAGGKGPSSYLKRYELLDQVSLVFLFLFEYALMLGLAAYVRSRRDHEEFVVGALFLLGCAALYVPHVVLRVKAYGKLERYVSYTEGAGLSGFTAINKVSINHSMR